MSDLRKAAYKLDDEIRTWQPGLGDLDASVYQLLVELGVAVDDLAAEVGQLRREVSDE